MINDGKDDDGDDVDNFKYDDDHHKMMTMI